MINPDVSVTVQPPSSVKYIIYRFRTQLICLIVDFVDYVLYGWVHLYIALYEFNSVQLILYTLHRTAVGEL